MFRLRGSVHRSKCLFPRPEHARTLEWAIVDASEAIRLAPASAECYTSRGNMHSRRGDVDRALADYAEAIRHDPSYVPAHVAIAEFISDVDQAGAVAHHTEAIQLEPATPEHYLGRANLS